MNIIYSILALIITAVLGVSVAMFKKPATRKTLGIIAGVMLALSVLAFSFAPDAGLAFADGKLTALAVTGAGVVADSGSPDTNQASACTFASTATWASRDKFGSTSVPGTAYYKVNGNPYTTTAVTAPNNGVSYQYWLENETYFVDAKTIQATCGTNDIVATSYKNGSLTITGFDLIGNDNIWSTQSITNTNNISLGANENAKVKFTVVGSAKTSNMPFGGLLVVETNSTLSSVSCSGDGISANSGKYKLTYTTTFAGNTYVVYEVAPGYDVSTDGGMTGVTKEIRCDFTNGATAPGANANYYLKLIPANWYLGNDGAFHLDVEKAVNADSTRTGKGGTEVQFDWSA